MIGLRTLLLAKRELTNEEYKEWNEKYIKATVSIENRDKKMEDIQELIEVNLVLVGATAIEDKLQDKVGYFLIYYKKKLTFFFLKGKQLTT